MPTPRSESITKARNGETTIHTPNHQYDIDNKIDHYAVLAQIINRGVDTYLDNPDYQEALQSAESLEDLQSSLRKDLETILLSTLESDSFITHHQSLVGSQAQRYTFDQNKWDNVKLTMLAGTSTFANSFTYLFKALQSTLGTEAASNPGNWQLADRLAKMNIKAFSIYYNTYLAMPENWMHFLEHVEIDKEDTIHFKPGYPGNAAVAVSATTDNPVHMYTRQDFDVSGVYPLIALKEVGLLEATIGCPVTFESSTTRKLWSTYIKQAQRVSADK